ncbi:recombinase family protein [Clostridium sp. C2-6-12]|uniref:recombinase family protein n=1 Tax=Clostridium sp. C2-6-12 TaxID=2698832 RepID=UPI00136ED390|nr:recombinase family protein [Clostridium sp. C2-6-12]
MNVAIYSRKSKLTGKGESIENQVQMCKDYLLKINRNNEIYNFLIYEDEGFSGGNINRPKFQMLMKDISLKKINLLICYRLDRISRNVSDFSTTLEILQKYNVNFISIREQFDTSSPIGRAMIYIASVFAQLERETIAERVRDNMLELAKSGRWLGGTPPFGYNSKPVSYYDENMTEHLMANLSENHEELEIVKLIYNKYLELKSLNALEAYLLQHYFKTRSGSNFRKSTLKLILTNPVYAQSSKEIFTYLEAKGMLLCGEPDNIHGFLTYNKLKTNYSKDGKHCREFRNSSDWIVAVSRHKGIIEANDWLKVQYLYSNNSNKFIMSTRSHNALLTGIIRCEKCGSPMRIIHGPLRNNNTKLYYYACTLKKSSKGSRCNNPNVRVDQIDSIIINTIKKIEINNHILIKNLMEKNKENKKSVVTDTKTIENNLYILIKQKKAQVDNLLKKLSLSPDFFDVVIPKIKELNLELNQLKSELNKFNDKILQSNYEESSLPFTISLQEGCSLIDNLTQNEKKSLIKGLINKISWNGVTKNLIINFN